jgi:hypothetical protein
MVLAATLVALLASPALAQRGRGGMFGGPTPTYQMLLLGQASVQKELKLSEDQVSKLKDAGDKLRESFQDLQGLEQDERAKKLKEISDDAKKTLTKILKKEQMTRLREISIQVTYNGQGPAALLSPEVAKELKLTADQKKKLQGMQQEIQQEMRKMREDGAEPAEMQKKRTEMVKAAKEKATKLLTDDQKKTWKKMTGEPFKGQITFGRRGGGR